MQLQLDIQTKMQTERRGARSARFINAGTLFDTNVEPIMEAWIAQ